MMPDSVSHVLSRHLESVARLPGATVNALLLPSLINIKPATTGEVTLPTLLYTLSLPLIPFCCFGIALDTC
jgi:hypothetical protein